MAWPNAMSTDGGAQITEEGIWHPAHDVNNLGQQWIEGWLQPHTPETLKAFRNFQNDPAQKSGELERIRQAKADKDFDFGNVIDQGIKTAVLGAFAGGIVNSLTSAQTLSQGASVMNAENSFMPGDFTLGVDTFDPVTPSVITPADYSFDTPDSPNEYELNMLTRNALQGPNDYELGYLAAKNANPGIWEKLAGYVAGPVNSILNNAFSTRTNTNPSSNTGLSGFLNKLFGRTTPTSPTEYYKSQSDMKMWIVMGVLLFIGGFFILALGRK